MKSPLDPRHKTRQKIIELLFALTFTKQKVTNLRVKKIIENMQHIDKIIEKAAPEFPISKINRIDLVILRLAVHELVFERKEPPKVIVDEAVELAKEYGGDTSFSFVNGALGKILKEGKWTTKN